MEPVKIFHNPKCGSSRNTLALIRNSGVEPVVVEYLKTPPTRDELKQLISDMGSTVREVLRQKEALYKELGLDAPHWTDEQLLDFIGEHPILMQRPIVATALGTRMCRPSEAVLDILPQPQTGAFTKEDGARVIDEKGQRVKTAE
ncbi:arsenate reductase (glutaredoxin) [Hydrogenophaga sp.]|uniref:arsenate reductase (glutaredoxin) n=1 Tax=Hydrogenophaga sp. TaxID=1904254 RepID=UPI002723F53B|nr:arsenate reductase (glutaredoxin) [Hydrogenophaga sp.]MDO8903797.1 arsenate reductase (glutaredoxin) [Hydrogenophaga sp.]